MKKIQPKKVNQYFYILLAVGCLIALVGANRSIVPIIVIGISLMFGGIIFKIVFYRCPHCNKFLDRSTGEYCPYCGKEIDS